MKGNLRIFSAILLTVLYGLAIGIIARSLPSDFRIHHSSAQENFVAELSAKLSHHSAQTESAIGNFVNLPAPSLKNSFTGHLAIVVVATQVLRTALSERTAFSRKALINEWRLGMLFPFHFFW